MYPPLCPTQDPARSAALAETALLDTPAEETFDRLTRLSAELLHAPISLLTLVAADHQAFKSSVGLPEPWASLGRTPLSHSICKHVVDAGSPVVIGDTSKDPLTWDNPAISDLGIASYAGMPLRLEHSQVLGTLCVADHVPRVWLPEELALLNQLSEVAEGEINQRVALQRSSSSAVRAQSELGELLAGVPPFRSLVEQSLVGIAAVTESGFSYVNPRFAEIFGYSQAEILASKSPLDLVMPEDRVEVADRVRSRLNGDADDLRFTFRGQRKDGEIVELDVQGTRTQLGGEPAIISTLLDVTERRIAQDALRAREEHFRRLVENAWNMVHTVDADGYIRYASPAVERVIGYAPGEMVGRQAADFVHPGDVGKATRARNDALADPQTPRSLELRLLHKDGSTRIVEASGTMVRDEAGSWIAVVHTQDVSKRKQAEQALHETEQRHRLVVQATNSAVWDWDIRTGGIVWNGHNQLLLRYRPDEMGPDIGWWYEHLHPEDRQPLIMSLNTVLDGIGSSWSYEHRFLRGDGSYSTVSNCCSVLRDADDTAVRVIGSMTDVTERRRQEETQRFLARASALLDESLSRDVTFASLARLAVPALADCCIVDLVDAEGRHQRMAVTHADPSNEKRLRDHPSADTDWQRYQVGQVVSLHRPVLVMDFREQVGCPLEADWNQSDAMLSLGLNSFIVVPLLTHDRALGAITLATAGRRFGPMDLLVAEDLAHRAAFALDHARMFEQAETAIRERDEILGVISHDLRNPLNAIVLTVGLLLELAVDRRTSEVRQLELIQRASYRMNRMVEDLLDVSSMDAGRFSLNRTEQDVASLVAEAESLQRPMAEQKSITLHCDAEEGLAPLHLDTHRVLRVLSNLLGNAVKFTPAGGAVTLHARRDGDSVRFAVSDTGPGIALDVLARVFDRYWQAQHGDRRGTGLGLAIAQGIVDAHGGRIWVESTPGRGAEFVFTLPLGVEAALPS